jgi:hypothetical protein
MEPLRFLEFGADLLSFSAKGLSFLSYKGIFIEL